MIHFFYQKSNIACIDLDQKVAVDGDLNLDAKLWRECVAASLELALRELDRIKELSGLEPPYDDVWFAVVAIKGNEWEKMRHDNPRDKDGRFVLYVNPAKKPER